MSGGQFNYDQYKIRQIADDIEQFILDNESEEKNEWGAVKGRRYTADTIDSFKAAVYVLKLAEIYAHRVDLLLSGDDGEDSFLDRLGHDLDKLRMDGYDYSLVANKDIIGTPPKPGTLARSALCLPGLKAEVSRAFLMNTGNSIADLSAAIGHACHKGFSPHHYQDRDWEKHERARSTGLSMDGVDCRIEKTRSHTPDDVEVFAMFGQTWGSTALGFGGIGGAAFTTAYTIILQSKLTDEYCVYFGGRLAYRVDRAGGKFFIDIANRNMTTASKAKGQYEQTE